MSGSGTMTSGDDGLDAQVAAALAEHPDLGVSREGFERFLRALPERPPPSNVADLYLAFGCAQGAPAALARFEALHFPELKRASAQWSNLELDELAQRVRTRLFTGTKPRIGEYRGKASLKRWFKAVVARVAINLNESVQHTRAHSEGGLAALTAEETPELLYLRQMYGRALNTALAEVIAALPAKERNVLRYWILERATIDELAVIYGVHRSSAARWLAQLRQQLLEKTRASLAQSLKVNDSELDSILRMLATVFAPTLRPLLDT
jgi:RNA polymerase sigma-70 factor, ECF subfamily